MARQHIILAGDIGGTKTNLALFGVAGHSLALLREERYHSAGYHGLSAMIHDFLEKDTPPVLAAGFGVPGFVSDGRAKPTNLAWSVNASEIAQEFGIPRVEVMNDLEANAHGIAHLQASDFAVVQQGTPGAKGNRCVVSPGTGLGQAGLYWDGQKHHVWACEGGHADFAPRNDLEIALLEHLIKQHGHVSAERVVSGMGIENIYKFLRDSDRGTELPSVASEMQSRDAGAVITQFANSGQCPMCIETLDIFVRCLGAESANMALKSMATGGVFLGGGIPAKLLSHIQGAAFLEAFHNKGRLSPVLEKMPVLVILNDQAALLGAAYHALDKATA
ncbi:MAG: glucokinase [bacterium]